MNPPSKDKRQALLQRIREMLWRDWDPIGVNEFPEAQDEYDSYAPDVSELVVQHSGYQEILDYLWWLETEQIGLRGDRPRTEAFARRLLELQNECAGGTGS